jgi:PIN domain nuclease of toxin-antitoxin system
LDISFWEIAMLIHSGRLRDDISPVQYMADLCLILSLTVLPITPEIATLSQGAFFLIKILPTELLQLLQFIIMPH